MKNFFTEVDLSKDRESCELLAASYIPGQGMICNTILKITAEPQRRGDKNKENCER